MIPYGKQNINQEDIDTVINVLNSDWLTQGSKVPEFETAVAKYCNAKHAVAVNSGTSALHIACLALELGSNDWLWTSPNTFVASANCGLYCGASVDFVDIDPDTYNMSVDALSAKLKHAEKDGKLPKVVVLVHFAGQSCEMQKVKFLSDKYGFKIIEDGCHAIGGKYENLPIGNCKYSDITVFSFHPVKVITTGEGGMAVTNLDEIAYRMRILRTHGIMRDVNLTKNETDGDWFYQQIELGFNYRLTDIQAALGISQLNRLDEFLEKRKKIVDRYNKQLSSFPVTLPAQNPETNSAWHLYVIKLRTDVIKKNRKQVFNMMRNKGVGVNVHYIPIHTQPYYQKKGFKHGDFPCVEGYYNDAITLPIFPELDSETQDAIVTKLIETIN